MGSWLWLSAEAREAWSSCLGHPCPEPFWMGWALGSRTARVSADQVTEGLTWPASLQPLLGPDPSRESQVPQVALKYVVPPLGLSMFPPASHAERSGAGPGTLSNVKRPQGWWCSP